MILDEINNSIKKTSWLTADFITATRLVSAIPLFIFVLQEWYPAALVIFVIMSLTDALDGYVARLKNSAKTEGTIFDAITDMIFIAPSFFILGFKFLDPKIVLTLAGLEILRGLLVLIGKLSKFPFKIRANLPGKIKAWFEGLGLAFLLLNPFVFAPLASWLFIIAIILAFGGVALHLYRGLQRK